MSEAFYFPFEGKPPIPEEQFIPYDGKDLDNHQGIPIIVGSNTFSSNVTSKYLSFDDPTKQLLVRSLDAKYTNVTMVKNMEKNIHMDLAFVEIKPVGMNRTDFNVALSDIEIKPHSTAIMSIDTAKNLVNQLIAVIQQAEGT